jgi:adenylate cyclase
LRLNPNDDLIVVQQGELMTWLGRADEGVDWILKAMRLNPYHPERFWGHLGRAYFVAHRYPEAIAAFQHVAAPELYHEAFFAACRARLGDAPAAQAHAQRVLALVPRFSIERYLDTTMHYQQSADRVHHRESLQLSGLQA